MNVKRTITASTMIVVIGYTAAKILGFLRESVLAYFYGATNATDAYVIALSLRTFIILGIGGAVITSAIPVASSVEKEKGQAGVFRLITSLANTSLVVSVLLVIIGSIIIRPVMGILAPGFDAETLDLAIKLTLIMFPTAVLSLLQSVYNALLQYRSDFSINATTDAIHNVATVGMVIIVGRYLGITAAAVGALISSLSMMVLQWQKLSALGYRHLWVIDSKDNAYRTVLLLIAPIMAASIVNHLGWMAIRSIGTGLMEGAVAFINYAQKLILMPYFIIGTSIITVFYPTLSRKYHEEGLASFLASLQKAMGTVYFSLAPIAAGAILLATPVVKLVYQRGAFTPEMTSATAELMIYMAISIPLQALAELFLKAIFVMKDTLTPLKVMLVSTSTSVAIAWALAPRFSYVGLAIGLTGQQVFALMFSSALFVKKVKSKPASREAGADKGANIVDHEVVRFVRNLLVSLGKTSLATLVMSASVLAARSTFARLIQFHGMIGDILEIGLFAMIGLVSFIIAAHVLKSEELGFAMEMATSFVGKLIDRMRRSNRI